jgi:hypothetical protein
VLSGGGAAAGVRESSAGERRHTDMQGAPKKNLWPKFILESAPLRATSSVISLASCIPNSTD